MQVELDTIKQELAARNEKYTNDRASRTKAIGIAVRAKEALEKENKVLVETVGDKDAYIKKQAKTVLAQQATITDLQKQVKKEAQLKELAAKDVPRLQGEVQLLRAKMRTGAPPPVPPPPPVASFDPSVQWGLSDEAIAGLWH